MWFWQKFQKYSIILILLAIQVSATIPKGYPLEYEFATIKRNDDREGRPWRLPNTSYPLKYDLHLTTWIHQEIRNFTGNVIIELMVTASTSELVLHARDLNIQRISIEDLTTKQPIENIRVRIVDDLLIISDANSESEIFVQNHRLSLEIFYTGSIKAELDGFNIMTYQDDNNKTIYGAYTQMEPLAARKVLPCYDEPALKANFIVRITHGSNYTAISNMPAISTEQHGVNNMTTTRFAETPLMSSYLLAFVISNYEFVAQESNGLLQRVFLPPNSEDNGSSALSHVVRAVQTFSDYMDVPYSLPKLDHIRINELVFAGMENWGLITYNKDYLNDGLVENHEIVHQWFGNLVSPEWWDSLWLNEGFATYYSYVLMDMLQPGIHYIKWLNCNDDSFYKDAKPVVQYIEKPNEIRDHFGNVYDKAACVIKMFEHAFGEPIFRLGVSNFLKARAFSTANENHLYDHLQAALLGSPQQNWNYSVHEIMRTWLHGKALPILTIARDTSNSNILHIQQRPSIETLEKYWWIPLNFATATQPNVESSKAVYYMPPVPEVTVNLNDFNVLLNKEDWPIVNLNGNGFYKTQYDNNTLLSIAKSLQTHHSAIKNFNRAAVLKSIPDILKDQKLPLATIEILKYLPQEQDPIVWIAICKALMNLGVIFDSNSESNELLDDFIQKQIRAQYLKFSNVPFDKLNQNEIEMKTKLTAVACGFKMPECLKRSRVLYEELRNRNFSGLTTLNSVDMCYIARLLSDVEYDKEIKKLRATPSKFVTTDWSPLLCTENEAQFEKLLQAFADFVNDNQQNLILQRALANLVAIPDKMKWNWVHTFLKAQIAALRNNPTATHELCKQMKSNAMNIRKPYHVKYIELMKMCRDELLTSGTIRDSSEIMPNTLDIGANYAFENEPLWAEIMVEFYDLLKQQNY